MVEVAHKIYPSTHDETGRTTLDRALMWKRVLLWSSILTMLVGAALFATLIT